jgi:hypothetical protein
MDVRATTRVAEVLAAGVDFSLTGLLEAGEMQLNGVRASKIKMKGNSFIVRV